MPFLERHLFICTNERAPDDPKGSCKHHGAAALRDAFKTELARRGLNKRIRTNGAGCIDQCAHGAAIVVYPEQVWYGKVTVADVAEIIDSHLVGGRVVERLLIANQPHIDPKRQLPIIQ